jgi:hypothetical protein
LLFSLRFAVVEVYNPNTRKKKYQTHPDNYCAMQGHDLPRDGDSWLNWVFELIWDMLHISYFIFILFFFFFKKNKEIKAQIAF